LSVDLAADGIWMAFGYFEDVDFADEFIIFWEENLFEPILWTSND
jgi:hypothetical protein